MITVIDNYWVKADVKSGVVDKGTKVTLTCTKSSANIYYTIDGSEPTNSSPRYTNPIIINKSLTLKAKAYLGNQESKVTTRDYKVYAHKAGETFEVTTKEGVKLTMKAYSSGSNVYLQVGDGLTSAISSNYSGNITIPEYCDDMLVHDIAKNAFLNSNITSVVIPGTYPIQIVNNAFEGCKKLKQFTYKGNWSLELYSESFKDCESLETFAYRGSNTIYFKKTSNRVFQNCNSLKTIYCDGSTGPITFNDNVFPETVYNSAILYVKEGRVAKFQSTAGWKKFKNIKEIGSDDDIQVTEITLNTSSVTLSIGDTKQLSASISPSNATNKSVTWSTSNSSVATVSSSGLVTAKSAGSATITCKANDGSGKYATCSITVKNSVVYVTSISLNTSSATLAVGDTKQLTATISPSNATNKSVTWSTNNSSVATVNSSGLVTAKSAGKATITCKANDGSGKYATCNIVVEDKPGPTDIKVKMVSAGGVHTMILKTDGTLWACGSNGSGQLCDGTRTDVTSPKQIMTSVESVSTGYTHTMILKKDGSLWACGNNDYGCLGDGTMDDILTPKQVMTGVKSVSAGSTYTMILKTDGSLWACGRNFEGQLGIENVNWTKTPMKLMTGVKSVSTGGDHTMILKTDGSLWACGKNYCGQLGDGTTTDRRTPKQIMTEVASVSAGGYHTMIVKTNGSLWACGNNDYGQLGISSYRVKTPELIMTDISSVSAGHVHTIILKTDGSLWACGSNEHGQLGDGTNIDRATPVKIAEGNGSSSGIQPITTKKQGLLPIYNLRGQRLNAPQKGINIIGGKKYVVK